MKTRYFFTTLVLLMAYLLSACGGTLPQAGQPSVEQASGDQAAVKVRAVEVAFTGVVEAIDGNAWTVNGQVLSVDPAVVRDGPFQVGDRIKVEGTVNEDGSLSIARVEAPTAADLVDLPQLGSGDDNANDNLNSNDNLNTNDNLNANDNANINDDNMNGNDNDDDDANTNINGNSNDDDDDDDHSNANSNSNDDDDDSNTNSNSNEDDHSGSNSNSNGDDDSSGGSNGNSNDSDDD